MENHRQQQQTDIVQQQQQQGTGRPIPDVHARTLLHQCTKMVQIGNQTENIQSQIHKVYLRMSADSGPVGGSLVLVAAAAEALEAVLAGFMAEEAAAQHEEAAAIK
uniref:Uncharacterized protein n=1 Tax=Aegilops tauschii TaxID=37682 RepID=R7WDG9_AEGTA